MENPIKMFPEINPLNCSDDWTLHDYWVVLSLLLFLPLASMTCQTWKIRRNRYWHHWWCQPFIEPIEIRWSMMITIWGVSPQLAKHGIRWIRGWHSPRENTHGTVKIMGRTSSGGSQMILAWRNVALYIVIGSMELGNWRNDCFIMVITYLNPWKSPFIPDFPVETCTRNRFSIATFDYQRVPGKSMGMVGWWSNKSRDESPVTGDNELLPSSKPFKFLHQSVQFTIKNRFNIN